MVYLKYEHGYAFFDRLNWQTVGHNPQNRIEMVFHLKIEKNAITIIHTRSFVNLFFL